MPLNIFESTFHQNSLTWYTALARPGPSSNVAYVFMESEVMHSCAHIGTTYSVYILQLRILLCLLEFDEHLKLTRKLQ